MDIAAPFHHAGTVTIDDAALSAAMAMRGLDQMGLARLSGLSDATISKALHRRRITGPTFARIAEALASAPVVELEGAERLLARPGAGDSMAAPAREAGAAGWGGHRDRPPPG